MEMNSKIYEKLRRLGVCTLYLFGSRAQGCFRPNSDYDFGVLLKDPRILRKGTMKLYNKIYQVLEDLVSKRANIDIVFLDTAPLQVRYHVVRDGRVLMDAHPMSRGRFIERVLEEHADFEPYRLQFEEATLARIS